MWHNWLHSTIDTSPLTPARTRLLMHIPPYNRLWALEFNMEHNNQHFQFHLSSGGQHHHGEASLQFKQLPHVPLCLGQQLLDVSHTCSLRDNNNSLQNEFHHDQHHQVQKNKLCTISYRDDPTSRGEASKWCHHRIQFQDGGASSKCNHYRAGCIPRLEQSPWCCQINYPVGDWTKDTCKIHSHWRCDDVLGTARISPQGKVEA